MANSLIYFDGKLIGDLIQENRYFSEGSYAIQLDYHERGFKDYHKLLEEIEK